MTCNKCGHIEFRDPIDDYDVEELRKERKNYKIMYIEELAMDTFMHDIKFLSYGNPRFCSLQEGAIMDEIGIMPSETGMTRIIMVYQGRKQR